MRIRPCIDIHGGKVKQVIGSTLRDPASADLNEAKVVENFVSELEACYYANLYRKMELPGGHIILLDRITDKEAYDKDLEQARKALRAFPGGMHIGGGITADNAEEMLSYGASHIIVTSYVFHDGIIDQERLARLQSAVGKDHIALDLSCRKKSDGEYYVVSNRWQVFTDCRITPETLDQLSKECDEFLIHAADVEGKRGGIDRELASMLGAYSRESGFPIVYAGGVRELSELELLAEYSSGYLDVTVGSALDLFGGTLSLEELVWKAGELTIGVQE